MSKNVILLLRIRQEQRNRTVYLPRNFGTALPVSYFLIYFKLVFTVVKTVLNFFVRVEQEIYCEIICFSTDVETTSGEYRSRTDDPLLAKQVL